MLESHWRLFKNYKKNLIKISMIHKLNSQDIQESAKYLIILNIVEQYLEKDHLHCLCYQVYIKINRIITNNKSNRLINFLSVQFNKNNSHNRQVKN